MKLSCGRCVYLNSLNSNNCGECSRNHVDKFTPTLKSIKLHTDCFDLRFTDLTIAPNQVGPGYYVGDQTNSDTLEWVCTVEEASVILVNAIRQEHVT